MSLSLTRVDLYSGTGFVYSRTGGSWWRSGTPWAESVRCVCEMGGVASEAAQGREGRGTGEQGGGDQGREAPELGPPARGSGEGLGACPRGFEADSERGLLRVEKAGQLRNDHV